MSSSCAQNEWQRSPPSFQLSAESAIHFGWLFAHLLNTPKLLLHSASVGTVVPCFRTSRESLCNHGCLVCWWCKCKGLWSKGCLAACSCVSPRLGMGTGPKHPTSQWCSLMFLLSHTHRPQVVSCDWWISRHNPRSANTRSALFGVSLKQKTISNYWRLHAISSCNSCAEPQGDVAKGSLMSHASIWLGSKILRFATRDSM